MFGEYAALAKWILIISAVTALLVTPYKVGRHLERSDWETLELNKTVQANTELTQANAKVKELSLENIRLQLNVEQVGQLHEDQINALHNSLVNTTGLQRKSVCTERHTSRSGNPTSTGKVIEEAADLSTFSTEVENALVSLTYDADQVGVWADEAFEWIQGLCKKPGFVCGTTLVKTSN